MSLVKILNRSILAVLAVSALAQTVLSDEAVPRDGSRRPGNGAEGRHPRPGPGNGNGGAVPRPEPTVVPHVPVVTFYDYLEIDDVSFIPYDVCLLDFSSGYRWRHYRGERSRVVVGRNIFCDWTDGWRMGLNQCRPEPRPQEYDLAGTESWTSNSANVTLSNKGGTTPVTLKSDETRVHRSFYNAAVGVNCFEHAGQYTIVVRRIEVKRVDGREVSRRVIDRDYDRVPGVRLLSEPVWRAQDSTVRTGRSETATFSLEVTPFEPQIEAYTFGATVSHSFGTEPRLNFNDEFFSHTTAMGNVVAGGAISIFSQVSPIRSPGVSVAGRDTEKKESKLVPLTVTDSRLATLLKMAPETQTVYNVSVDLEREKGLFGLGSEKLGVFRGQVVKADKNAQTSIDIETVALVNDKGEPMKLDRSKSSYDLKVTVTAQRSNTKFVTSEDSSASPELKIKAKKLK